MKSFKIAVCIFALCICVMRSSTVYPENTFYDYLDYGEDWNWEGVSSCYTSSVQSPIDLVAADHTVVAANQYMFARYSPSTVLVRKFNTTIVLTATSEDGLGYLYYITTLNLAGTFRLDNIRFRTPAEHTINGVQYAMEVQLFHVYGFSQKPVNDKVVVSLLFQVDDTKADDPFLDMVINTPDQTTSTMEVDMSAYLNMSTYSMNYFYYLGSMTFPYCSANYNWIVIDQFFYANSKQINAIHANYMNTDKIKLGNYRSTQNRKNIFVRYNGDPNNPLAISNQPKTTDQKTQTTEKVIDL